MSSQGGRFSIQRVLISNHDDRKSRIWETTGSLRAGNLTPPFIGIELGNLKILSWEFCANVPPALRAAPNFGGRVGA